MFTYYKIHCYNFKSTKTNKNYTMMVDLEKTVQNNLKLLVSIRNNKKIIGTFIKCQALF